VIEVDWIVELKKTFQASSPQTSKNAMKRYALHAFGKIK